MFQPDEGSCKAHFHLEVWSLKPALIRNKGSSVAALCVAYTEVLSRGNGSEVRSAVHLNRPSCYFNLRCIDEATAPTPVFNLS